jgi:CTP:molybdopterin cytidylyltransferase MocA
MADPRNICAVILAAGASRRFGSEDKLAAQLHGKMLGLYVSGNLSDIDWGRKYVVASAPDHPCAPGWLNDGFEVLINADATQGMSTSVALAAKLALDCRAEALLICLADMPLVPVHHSVKMIESFGAPHRKIATAGKNSACPPALFGREYLEELATLSGDTGARQFLGNAATITLADQYLVDVDDPQTLELLNACTKVP